jgi:GntR family transcriptional regulator
MMRLDHSSAVPLRAQVEALLRELLHQPQYQQGALLPDEIRLARQLGVSRGTVRAGIVKLVYEGLLERKAGVGTRASSQHLESGIQAWRSFTREMESKGIKVENYRLDYRLAKASPPAARALQIDGGEVWRLERVRGWDSKPVLSSSSWFHPRLGLNGAEDFSRPIYETLEAATGVRPARAREEFLAVRADSRRVKMLQVSRQEPLLLRRHIVFDAGNRPIEFAEVHYVSSRFTVTLDLRREKKQRESVGAWERGKSSAACTL